MLVKVSLKLIYVGLKRSLLGLSKLCVTLNKTMYWFELKFTIFLRAQ